ncbi:MAG: LD-carboxypeptidase [Ignavibacteriae bacterium]|nr:LD-carboxypeptidase [Ignavibacteriota bacterium]
MKPKALRRGDVIGICAPGSPPSSAEKIDRGIAYLERLGYHVELGRNLYRKRGYLAGSDTQRTEDLHELFANRNVKAMFTVRGGYGSHRILNLLNYNLIKRNPKIFVGYSDVTALQLTLFRKTGLVSFSGPMVAVEMAAGLRGEAEEHFWRILTSTKPLPPLKGKTNERLSRRKPKSVTGRLIGGNLSIVAALLGTRYFPTINNLILLLEEIDERPYRIDRMLQQIQLSDLFQRLSGIVLGKFKDCVPERGKPSLTLQQVFRDSFKDFNCPILSDIRYGHINNSLTIPLGVRVRINAQTRKLEFLEAGVS